jgi:glucokinase
VSGGAQAIGIDVGGTKTAALRVAADGSILARETLPTPAQDTQATLETIVRAARAVLSSHVGAVGIGAAGLVERATGRLTFAPNIAWRDVPLVQHLRDALTLPVLAENDATAAAWGEHRLGSGHGHDDLLLVTVGTGIGGGIVGDGRLFRGAHGFAAEIGHQIVEPDGPPCGCGNRGCWEQVASGHAIAREGREAVRRDPGSVLGRLVGGDPARVTGQVVTSAALGGDETAMAIVARVGRRLGQGIAGLVNVLDPEIVVVGGGAIKAGDLLLEPARSAFLDAVEGPGHRPPVPIVEAALGNDAGAIGAAILALEELA